MEAPVSGSKQPAEQGQLIFLCGGHRELFDNSIPLLEVMGKAHFFLGKVGNGANMVRDGIYNRGRRGCGCFQADTLHQHMQAVTGYWGKWSTALTWCII